jgi:site-specific DNA-methyltransferase (adenine-specific)
MGKKWDYDVPSVEVWQEALRVLKPGGHLLSFAGARTYHRMAVNIEDAGFEIRDQIMWLYGSGFPKSHNIGKAMDKLQGNDREVVGVDERFNEPSGIVNIGQGERKKILRKITKGNSEWEGWGTALKPAHEPIVVARKPLGYDERINKRTPEEEEELDIIIGELQDDQVLTEEQEQRMKYLESKKYKVNKKLSVAQNVLKHGTGGINIDECRVGDNEMINQSAGNKAGGNSLNMSVKGMPQEVNPTINKGRFPANLIHDGSDEVVSGFPETKS